MRAGEKFAVLFTVPSGSRLYGTDGPNSDYDFKSVYLPDLNHLLLNKRVATVKQKPEGKKDGEKMLAGEEEREFVPLQVFMDDFYGGQTYAVETAFAVLADRFDVEPTLTSRNTMKLMMQELVGNFLTNNIKAMVGYAVGQSKLYGMKTERYASMKKVVELLQAHPNPNDKLEAATDLVNALLAVPFVKATSLANARGGYEMAPALDVVGKQFPLTNRVQTVLASVDNSLDQYGARVQQFEGQGADWKALSHATRITEQVLQLVRTGVLTFPVQNAEYLRNVKEGKVDFDSATTYLAKQFDQVDEAVAASHLKPRSPERDAEFEEWKLKWLRGMYGLDY